MLNIRPDAECLIKKQNVRKSYDTTLQHLIEHSTTFVLFQKKNLNHNVSTLLLSLFTQSARVTKRFLVSDVGVQLSWKFQDLRKTYVMKSFVV